MNQKEANYILQYFSRLMTAEEVAAKKHHLFSAKLGEPGEHESEGQRKSKIAFYQNWNATTDREDILALLEDGYDAFILKAAERIAAENPGEYRINRCKQCDTIARTPYARQCANCGHKWHDKVAGEFQFNSTFKMPDSSAVWLVGEMTRGGIEVGNVVDLTNFQLHIIAEIGELRLGRKAKKNKQRDSLFIKLNGLNLEEKEMIKEHLRTSATMIQILKEA